MKKNALTICLAIALVVAIVFCFVFNGQKNEVEKKLSDTAASLETATADASKLKEEVDSAKEELAAAVSSLEAKTTEAEELSAARDAAQAEAEAAKAAAEAVQAELDSVNTELTAAREAAATALTSHEEETSALKEELAKVTAKAEAAEETIESIRSLLTGETGEMTSEIPDETVSSPKTSLEVLLNLFRVQGKAVSLKRVPTYLGKYFREGQAVKTSLRYTPGEHFSALYPDENISAVFTDLMNALGFRATLQAKDQQAQADVALQLNGDDALDLCVALSPEGIFAKSVLLGEGIYAATPSELKTAAGNLVRRLAESGNLPQEQADSLLKVLGVISLPTAQEIQSVDYSGLQEAALRYVSSWTVLDIKDQPPEALPEADTVLVIPVEKEQLRSFLEEAAKILVQFPSVQTELAARELTQEGLIFKIASLADYLTEDTAIRLYTTPDYTKCYLTFAASLKGKQSALDAAFDLLSCAQDGALSLRYTDTLTLDGKTVQEAGTAVLTEKTLSGTYSACTRTGDGDPVLVAESDYSCSAEYTETESRTDMVMNSHLYPQPDADPVVLTARTAAVYTDLGDHAEGNVATVLEQESLGEILTVNFSQKTEPADAYLCEDAAAIHPMALTKEERDALKQAFQTNAQTALTDFLRKLPESFIQILMPQPQK